VPWTSDEETRFRRWLVDRLVESKWPGVRGEDRAVLARRLGVNPAVLDEAELELRRRAKGEGTIPAKLGSPEFYRQPNVNVRFCECAFPTEVYKDWQAYCRSQGVTESVALRSLVHTLLSGPRQPSWLGRAWCYKDKMLKLVGYGEFTKAGKKWPYTAKTEISKGAESALIRRAQMTGATPAALVRGQVIDLLEGRVERLLIATGPRAMWDDARKYWTLERRP